MANWVPRGVDPSSRDVLVEGVPHHMRGALLEFLRKHLTYTSATMGYHFLRRETLLEYDLVARPRPAYAERLDGNAWPGFVSQLPDEEILDLADWITYRKNRAVGNELEEILSAGGSVWGVGPRNGNSGLIRRVTEGVQVAVEASFAHGSAGSLLAEAWAAVYGRSPNPEEAYEKAIKAVEQAAIPIVSPANTRATLGTVIRDMKAQANWSLLLEGTGSGVAVTMAEVLWTSQASRHGGNGYRRPSQQEAETAVTLAAALLQLFAAGLVKRAN